MTVLTLLAMLDALAVRAVVTSQHTPDSVWQEHDEVKDSNSSGWSWLSRLDCDNWDSLAISSDCSWRVLPYICTMAKIIRRKETTVEAFILLSTSTSLTVPLGTCMYFMSSCMPITSSIKTDSGTILSYRF